ncbi:unnamed protein product [Rhodiola kirilowii]
MLSPTPESPARIADDESDYQDAVFGKRGRWRCCWLPCLRKWGRIETERQEEEEEEQWWRIVMMKVREWSEIAAGPKWKTFIRRFRKNRFRHGASKFRYDPLSYALNFDETAIQSSNCCDEDSLRRDFSTRYASIPGSVKSSSSFS